MKYADFHDSFFNFMIEKDVTFCLCCEMELR
jgi:hypothetical protein